MVLEDASRKHLQLHELHEDVNELMDNLCQEQNLRHDLEVRMYANESQLAAAENRILKMEADLRRERDTAADCRRDVENRENEVMLLRMELMDARNALEQEQETTNVSERKKVQDIESETTYAYACSRSRSCFCSICLISTIARAYATYRR